MASKSELKSILANMRYHKFGTCNVCGKRTIFLCTDLETARGNMFCLFCRSSSRKRHVAKHVICDAVRDISCIAQIPALDREISIYVLETGDAFYKALKEYPHFFSSTYDPDIETGNTIGDRIYCQNVEELTFDDSSFDIVISEDIFEHVRNYKRGFESVARVLKPGGYHIFTVPFNFHIPTIVRVDTSTDEDIHLLPPEYHGDRIRGQILAYRTFGTDLFNTLQSLGFETTAHFSKYADQKNGIFDSYVFVSQKT